jgi:hypothetical protein
MFALLLAVSLSVVDDSKPLITQEIVDKINSDPNSPFKAALHPQFAKMTIGQARKFLAPVRKNPVAAPGHGSPRPVGANEREFINLDKKVFTGYYQRGDGGFTSPWTADNQYTYKVYSNAEFCSSWAPAVTSAMSLAISIHHKVWKELSIQFILDCDLMGDPCVERPPLNAYEQFWRRYIPQASRWDQPSNKLRPPYFTLTQEKCNQANGCYPGWSSCPRNLVMTGSCEPGGVDTNCPIYFLYNWRWIKSHLWEVGPVTSSVLVRQEFFAYQSGVYSSLPRNEAGQQYVSADSGHFINTPYTNGPEGDMSDVLGMLDVTIIGWGQVAVNLSTGPFQTAMYNRWWYVIPHLGADFGEDCASVFEGITDNVRCAGATKSGIMRFNRRFDDSSIESQAVGAVPFNFHPLPLRTPQRTGYPQQT